MKSFDIDGNVVVKYIYTLGAAGERLKVEELDRTVEYTYDDLYRLTSETITEGDKTTTYTYAYDNVSNRILKTENDKETAYVYNSLNQLVSDSETSYEYDLNGNLVRFIGSAHSALYEYNCENKLVKATVQHGNNVIEESYTYDYAGNRTSKTTRTNGHVEFVKYLNDTNSELTNVLCELDENGTEKCVYTIGADLISQERNGKVSVYLYDGHGSVVGLATMDGKITDTYTYDAFGNLIKSTGSTKNCYRYCGEQFDETTGLYYLRARYMDTSTGRFISQDSYDGNINDPISLHKYIYCNSNPVMYTDPTGFSVGGSLSRQMVAIGCFAIICDIVLINYHNVLHSLVDGLIKVADEINNVYIQIEEILIDIRLRINVCFALASRVINESLSNTTLGNLDINFSSLFENVAAYVYWQLLEYGNKYGNDYEHHHIVAKDEPRAFVAQMVFHHVGISVEDKNNLVWVRKAIHKFLHTNEYYFWINREIGEAYFSSLICGDYSASQQYVINKLAILKAMIYGLNILLN